MVKQNEGTEMMKATLRIAGLLLTLASPVALAADGDMRLGTFGIVFCGAPATFEVTSKERNAWVFNGKIRIHGTGEYDSIRITQYDNNSLRITRWLSGANFGETQRADTGRPRLEGGKAIFRAIGGRGVGCNNPGADTQLEIPQ